jgi:hypothetical protein
MGGCAKVDLLCGHSPENIIKKACLLFGRDKRPEMVKGNKIDNRNFISGAGKRGLETRREKESALTKGENERVRKSVTTRLRYISGGSKTNKPRAAGGARSPLTSSLRYSPFCAADRHDQF